MNREQLIRECLMLTCFLENINTNNKIVINRIIIALRNYSMDELEKYYKVNMDIREIRIDRMMLLEKEITNEI